MGSIAETYRFDQDAFEPEGIHKETRQYFMHLLADFEKDFHEKHKPLMANHLMANDAVMDLITRSLNEERNYTSGMELIDGQIDLDTNLEIDKFKDKGTIYAIGSCLSGNEEEPIFLVIFDNLPNGMVDLCWYSDDDDETEEEPVTPDLVAAVK